MAQLGRGLFKAPFGAQDAGKNIKEAGIAWPLLQRAAEKHTRPGVLAFLMRHQPKEMQRVCIPGMRLQDRLIEPRRILQPASLVMSHGFAQARSHPLARSGSRTTGLPSAPR